MAECFLRAVRVTGAEFDHDLFPYSNIEDIEIWTTKSKVVSEEIKQMRTDLEFVSLIDPSFTPLWAIVDKPYKVYTSNQQTLEIFQKLINYSSINGNVIQNAILTKISKEIYLLFYIEKTKGQMTVNCILLDINFDKFKEILSKQPDHKIESDSYFIDDIVDKKDDLIDTLLKQKSINFSNLNSKRQAELSIKQQQLQRSQIRQQFKKIIVKNVKNRMGTKSKPLQTEVAEVCFKGMCHKFRDVLETNEELLKELQKWIEVFLDILGE